MFKNKLLFIAPVIAFIAVFIFSLTLIPSVQPKSHNLPIAIVNEDQGFNISKQQKLDMGATIVKSVKDATKTSNGSTSAIKWVELKTSAKAQKGMDQQKYYAALVIPKDFSRKQASLRTKNPSSSEIQVYINQGMNSVAATMATQVLDNVVENVNKNIRTQLLQGFDQQGGVLTTKQAASLVSPVVQKVKNVNATGTNSANGNAPVSLFQPTWIASLVSAIVTLIAVNKFHVTNRKEKFLAKVKQVLVGMVIAAIIGFGLTWLASSMVGFHIPKFMDTALFLSITAFSFFLMISAVLSWLGLRSIGLFALLLFFSAPLLLMVPEMMPTFYKDWIYPWLPMRFMIQGLRELFFFNKGLTWNHSLSTLVWIAIVGMIVTFLSTFKSKANKKQVNEQTAV